MTSSSDLFQLSPMPMWIFDTQTYKFMDVNEAAVRIYGYSREEFLSKTIVDISGDSDLDLKSKIESHTRSNLYYKEVHTYIKSDGQQIIVEVESNVIQFEGKECRLVLALDITDRIQSELRVRESAERFDIVSKATSDTIWDWSLKQDTITWNKGIKGIFGYKNIQQNTTTSSWWKERIHPQDRDRVLQGIQNHIDNKIPRWKEEYRFRCADDSYKHIFDRGFLLFTEHGQSARMIGAMEDISKRKLEEHWSKLLESVVINATDGVVITDANSGPGGPKIIYVNDAYSRMSGYAKEELLDKSPRIFRGRNSGIESFRKIYQAVANHQSCTLELVNYTKTGTEYWVSLNITPVSDSTGTLTHWIAIQRDITESRKYIKAIEEQNKKFKEIAWIQSHLVRAPLARVMALLDLLKHYEPGDETDILLEHLMSSAKDLDNIIINIADKTPVN
ncbi:MAG: PAS domain S-box protein [Pedobacter sp.]|nr:MAG: PAS domain S-box protein [Pedobacter sp.]